MHLSIPFSPPDITEQEIQAVTEVLRSGWITTGPKVKQFEAELAAYLGTSLVLCLNSATAGLELILRIWGIGPGDEVIVPAYTYAATANVVLHVGAVPVMADCAPDSFNIDPLQIDKLITPRTKAVIPVDFGGWPVDYDEIFAVLESHRADFRPSHPHQEALGRILLLADSAHAFGAEYRGRKLGGVADISVFSFHAVKNLTTGEGGAVSFSDTLPGLELYRELKLWSLHGQNKDAHTKQMAGSWKYEIQLPGYKYNMTDLAAALGIVQLQRYPGMLKKRQEIHEKYREYLEGAENVLLPPFLKHHNTTISSWHLFPVRIRDAGEEKRDRIIVQMAECGIGVNVHFIPLPLHPLFRELGYNILNFPSAYHMYENEISLPCYPQMNQKAVQKIKESLVTYI